MLSFAKIYTHVCERAIEKAEGMQNVGGQGFESGFGGREFREVRAHEDLWARVRFSWTSGGGLCIHMSVYT